MYFCGVGEGLIDLAEDREAEEADRLMVIVEDIAMKTSGWWSGVVLVC